jgi:hypothetical protein
VTPNREIYYYDDDDDDGDRSFTTELILFAFLHPELPPAG